MKLDIESMRSLYRLNHMSRYNTWPRIHNESVAAHSFYVVLFTMMICDRLGVEDRIKLEAMQIATVHDIPETIMNDVTYDAKKQIDGLNELLGEFERKYIMVNFPEQYFAVFGSNSVNHEIARLIVKLADVYSVVQYCDNEVQLGNKPFEKLLEDSFERASAIIKKLEGRYNVSCQKITICNQ